jgi:DNA-directed RNA polymerase subunit beta'
LFDVAQDVIIATQKCKADKGFVVYKGEPSGIDIPISKHTRGRYASADVLSPAGEVIVARDEFITNALAEKIEKAGVKSVEVYSPLTCAERQGICARCYGMDLGTGEIVAVGEAVGTVAAQAIGEPATQLTMRTFHTGGAATVGGDITQGLPRVEEVFERRLPKNAAVVCRVDGEVTEIREQGREKIIVVLPDPGSVKKGGKRESVEYIANFRRVPAVKVGDKVKRGTILTDGSADISELYKFGGREIAERYIINETNRIYELQGASVSRKHIEVIVRQMFSRLKVRSQGDSPYVIGDVLERAIFEEENEALNAAGKLPIEGEALVMGITDVSLTRQSFLSAASFQWTTKVLIRSAIRGSVDHLKGLKENIIIGRLMPAGSGFEGSEKSKMVKREE